MTYSKTVGSSQSSSDLDSLRHESIERMKLALLSASLDNPTSAASAIRQVTIMRVYHQVTRIVEYLDLMDTLETNLYRSIRLEMNDIGSDESNLKTITKLLTIQEKLQKSIIESNKLLQPFVENAVIHGLQNSGSRGIIGIKAFCINDRLIIKILDNGVGISKEMAERIENKEISYPSDHLGIANTKCRLNSFYNGDYTIKVKGFKNRGTVITIDVPVPE